MENEKNHKLNPSKNEDCKALLPEKKRCPNGKIQESLGKCRPAQSSCKDSSEYGN